MASPAQLRIIRDQIRRDAAAIGQPFVAGRGAPQRLGGRILAQFPELTWRQALTLAGQAIQAARAEIATRFSVGPAVLPARDLPNLGGPADAGLGRRLVAVIRVTLPGAEQFGINALTYRHVVTGGSLDVNAARADAVEAFSPGGRYADLIRWLEDQGVTPGPQTEIVSLYRTA